MVTDQLIQKTVRDCFEGCTVLTIAHRLRTVIDFDRIIMMDAGQIIEYGEPHELLQAQWHFYNLVGQTGAETAAHLAAVAKEAYDARRGVVSTFDVILH